MQKMASQTRNAFFVQLQPNAKKAVTICSFITSLDCPSIDRAEMKRHFARTNFNETSSRSHTVFSTSMECTQTYNDGAVIAKKGDMKLVDLAGNERASAAEGVEAAKVMSIVCYHCASVKSIPL